MTPDEARAHILAGRTVRVATGSDLDDPICLHYLDRCYEDWERLLIYSESIAGWSEGGKEAICEPESAFYVEFVADRLSLTLTDQDPPQRETRLRRRDYRPPVIDESDAR